MNQGLTRRELIGLGAAALLAPLLGHARQEGPRAGFSFTFFSDTHVGLTRNVQENLDMVARIMQGPELDFGINGGDVVEYGWAGEYDQYAAVRAALPLPVYHVPGNHDVRWAPRGLQIFSERLGEPFSTFDHEGCRFILLDSTVPLSHWGHYEASQLAWLRGVLADTERETPLFIVTHHWVGRDDLRVDNELELLRLLEPYNVKLIFNGHGHSDLLWDWEGLTCTMNKGLYQGSWQRVEVDRRGAEVRLLRATTDQPEPQLLATVPLTPRTENRPIWPVVGGVASLGARIAVPSGPTEFRWNKGAWQPVPAEGVPTAGLYQGHNRLFLRGEAGGPTSDAAFILEKDAALLTPRWTLDIEGGVMSHLVVEGDVLFASTLEGSVWAIDRHNGTALARMRTGGYCHSTPCVAGETLVVGSADGRVYGFDWRTGRKRWETPTRGPVYAGAAVVGRTAVIASGDGSIYGLDLAQGTVRWTTPMPVSNTAFAQSRAATDGERVFIGAWDCNLYALDPESGEILWFQPCTDRFAWSPAIGSPAVAPGRVLVPTNGNRLLCFDTSTGEEVWRASSAADKFGHSSPRVVGDRIVVGGLGDLGLILCRDLATGEPVWECATRSVIYDSSPAVTGGFVAIGSVEALLSVADLATGRLAAQIRLPEGHFLGSPAAADGVFYVGTFANQVRALAL